MPTIADHIIDIPKEYYISSGVEPLHDYPSFNPYSVRDNDLIFVKTDYIVNGSFQEQFLDKIYCRFNLITGVSSYNLGRDGGDIYKVILDHPNLNKWICTNPPNIDNKKIIPIPIGFQEPQRSGGNQQFLDKVHKSSIPFKNKKDLIFMPYHDISTNSKRREMIDFLKSLSFVVVQQTKQSIEDYYDSMNQYKFVIGLEGRGPDIHRNYEAMLVGSIPINTKNVIQKVFEYHGADAIFLNSWRQLEVNLFNKLVKISYNDESNNSFLKVKNHIKHIRDIIK